MRWLIPIALVSACSGEAVPPAPSIAATAASVSHEAPASAEASPTPTPDADPADCDRVQPCAEAFMARVPPELAAPAHIAVQQLDHTLVESPARAAACSGAMASFRADLTQLAIEIPESCR